MFNFKTTCAKSSQYDHPIPQLCKLYDDITLKMEACGDSPQKPNPDLDQEALSACACVWSSLDILKDRVAMFKTYAQCRYSDTPVKNVAVKEQELAAENAYNDCKRDAATVVQNKYKAKRCKPGVEEDCECLESHLGEPKANFCALSKNLDQICIPCKMLEPTWGRDPINCERTFWGSFSDIEAGKNRDSVIYKKCQDRCNMVAAGVQRTGKALDKIDKTGITGGVVKIGGATVETVYGTAAATVDSIGCLIDGDTKCAAKAWEDTGKAMAESWKAVGDGEGVFDLSEDGWVQGGDGTVFGEDGFAENTFTEDALAEDGWLQGGDGTVFGQDGVSDNVLGPKAFSKDGWFQGGDGTVFG